MITAVLYYEPKSEEAFPTDEQIAIAKNLVGDFDILRNKEYYNDLPYSTWIIAPEKSWVFIRLNDRIAKEDTKYESQDVIIYIETIPYQDMQRQNHG